MRDVGLGFMLVTTVDVAGCFGCTRRSSGTCRRCRSAGGRGAARGGGLRAGPS